MLNIIINKSEDNILLSLHGKFDMNTIKKLDNLLEKEIPEVKKIVFSLTNLESIDLTAINILIKYFHKYSNGGKAVEIVNKNLEIEEILKLIGLREYFKSHRAENYSSNKSC
ncbi:MAG: STAS domain-containing protein [Bacillota bacterium]|nr:STAS domain-containing protein [Bacillota bacterium]